MQRHLTDMVVQKLREGIYFDKKTPGFGIRVGKTRKTWFYVDKDTRRRLAIGKYPEVSLSVARKEAKQLLANGQPGNIVTKVVDALSLYYRDCEKRITSRSLIEYQRHLRKLPEKTLEKISSADIDTGDAHAVNACKVFMNWCIRNGFTDHNPFRNIPIKYGQRERILSSDEIKALWIYEYPPYSDVVKLLLLTGQRRGEIMALQPKWLENDVISFPAEITKNRKPHTLPFGNLTAHYLGKAPFSFNGWGNGQKRMHRHLGFDNFVLHDLRRTCASIHVEIGTPVHVTEALLNHSSGSISGVAKVYIRTNLLNDMRTAVLRYEEFIRTLVSP